jgi:hypothetical protein
MPRPAKRQLIKIDINFEQIADDLIQWADEVTKNSKRWF